MAPQFGLLFLPDNLQALAEEAALADALGFDWLGVGDSQSLFRELYVSLAVVAQATRRVRLGPTVSAATTRHPAVTASAIASINELSGGRAFLGLGTGDSAIYNLNARPASHAVMRDTIRALHDLLAGKETAWGTGHIHANWIPRPVPIYLAAEGPKTLRLAGEIADGVIVGTGLLPAVIADSRARIRAGAEAAGRDPDTLDVWWLVKCNVQDDSTAALDEIKMGLAASANHGFRFTLEGKHVPPEYVEPIRQLLATYRSAEHESLGGHNSFLPDRLGLTDYLRQRFGAVGTPEEVVEQIRAMQAAGADQLLLTCFSHDRPRLIRTLGERVLPFCQTTPIPAPPRRAE